MIQDDKKILPVALHISRAIYHMIVIYGILVQNDDISRGFFSFLKKFWYSGLLGGERPKNGPKWEKTLSVMLNISGIIYHMIFIYGNHV